MGSIFTGQIGTLQKRIERAAVNNLFTEASSVSQCHLNNDKNVHSSQLLAILIALSANCKQKARCFRYITKKNYIYFTTPKT
jgi:dimeric dUTPase (all-alpha-NTP-PPase superfamily)